MFNYVFGGAGFGRVGTVSKGPGRFRPRRTPPGGRLRQFQRGESEAGIVSTEVVPFFSS